MEPELKEMKKMRSQADLLRKVQDQLDLAEEQDDQVKARDP